MNKPLGVSLDELERGLVDYYRRLGDLSVDGPRARDVEVFERVPRGGRFADIVRLAAVVAGSAALLGVLVAPRVMAPVPAAGPTGAPTKATFAQIGQADQAGLMRTGGVWVTSGSFLDTTTDHGATWRSGSLPVPPNTGVNPIVDIFVLDPDHAWTVTLAAPVNSQSELVGYAKLSINRTNDGGKTWQQVDAPASCTYPTAKISFVDTDHGYLACADVGTIARTDDGGATWVIQGTCPYLGYGSIEASDQSTLWAAASGALTGPSTVLVVSRDGGRTFNKVALPGLDTVEPDAPLSTPSSQSVASNASVSVPIAPAFSDSLHGVVAVSIDVSGRTPVVRFFKTSDAGQSWTTAEDQVPYHSNQLAEVAEGPVWATVAAQTMSVSLDAGSRWQDFTELGVPENSAFSWFGFSDSGHGAALVFVSPDGPQELLLTDDGGRTWHPAHLGSMKPTSSPTEGATPTTP